ncbi:MAG: 50S ribosomal protein L15P [Candidatus Heimdallarchaeota archaeon LC_2]|nr:MAG: 50S ribosomal protein L15P [Candidatus Heimdallarchaeota archaeon LC_2]
MVVRRTKKVRRQRSSRSHGWGVVKDHKGAGMRGGRGNAGVTQHHWIATVKAEKASGKKLIGKYGFKRPQQFIKKYNTINVSHLNESADTLVDSGKAVLKGKTYTINLNDLGVSKLLAQGDVTKKMNITVSKATDRAVSKIKKAGGKVTFAEKVEKTEKIEN